MRPRTLLTLTLGAALFGACSDDAAVGPDGGEADAASGNPDAAEQDVLPLLQAMPDTEVTEWFPAAPELGSRYFHIYFFQEIDHDDPGQGGFWQYTALIHRSLAAPMVVYTSGYEAGRRASMTEPAAILDANQISIEYRFYGSSKPESPIDWTKLNVTQASADEHVILEKLKAIYGGNYIATGGSKGGEHALQHYRLHPDDVDGVVAYVAPVITDLPDLRYDGILDALGDADCRTRLRAVQRKTLEHHAAMESRALAEDPTITYEVAGVAHATETAIVELEFAFWMTRGEADCGLVPDATADDDALWTFLDETSGPAGYSDPVLDSSGSQYLYQDMTELGYPIWMHAHLDDLMQFSYEDWSVYLPAGAPVVYDPTVPRDLAAWLATDAERVMLVSGEWDPWSPAVPTIDPSNDSLSLWVSHGSHWSTGIWSLGTADADTAISTLTRWAGLANKPSASPRPALARPAIPMAIPGPDAPWRRW
jgi:PS-10 peptidase S37